MDDGYLFRKFTDKDLDKFDLVEKQVSKIPHIKESLEFILIEMYAFSNYITEKKLTSNKKLKSKIVKKKNIAITNMLEETEMYEENLSLKERLYIAKLKNLYILQEKRLNIHTTYPDKSIKNRTNYFLEDQQLLNEENISNYIIFFGGKEKAELLINEWKKNKFIDDINTEKVLSIFCDSKGNNFTTLISEKIKWNTYNTDLGFFFREMINGRTKLISDKEIWVKVSKYFLDKNGMEIAPNNISAASQVKNPKNKLLIQKIINNVVNRNFN